MTSTDLEIKSADGTRLVVRRTGAGDPVVLLHGSGGGLHSWSAVAERLAGSFELWMPARRGYHPSDVPPGRKSLRHEVADVLAVLDTIGRPVHLVGGSYGAMLALHVAAALAPHVAAAEPARLRSLALFEPPLFAAGSGVRPLLDRYRAALDADDAAGMFNVLNEVTRVPPAVVAAFRAAAGDRRPDPASSVGWLHDLEALTDDTTTPATWSTITVPTLLMQGADTWEPMPATMNALAEVIPGLRRVIWPGQSHFVTMTAPDLVAEALDGFFVSCP
ncbi:hypothetical protein Q0Z83_049810 [Actinoplanes sichuanensis]|uniref:Alpha/beta fold hydrolase n=1 Tax=Actinoplanes sichuanensis TaxID=512349 RepID=A0ABW4AQI6_9ACTN|nr:alpha/beta hydrolase [Actinoplanes sichuanensis]BEL06790.1 hypothetical protein Q0Z83_049810 [Actinoplanes sichuanensis]